MARGIIGVATFWALWLAVPLVLLKLGWAENLYEAVGFMLVSMLALGAVSVISLAIYMLFMEE